MVIGDELGKCRISLGVEDCLFLKRGHGIVIDPKTGTPRSLKEKGEVKILISRGGTKSVYDFRGRGEPDIGLVIKIDDPIVVQIYVFNIPTLHRKSGKHLGR